MVDLQKIIVEYGVLWLTSKMLGLVTSENLLNFVVYFSTFSEEITAFVVGKNIL